MKPILLLATLIVAATCFARAQDLTGDWQGTLSPVAMWNCGLFCTSRRTLTGR